jgi:hypothetical protein
MDDLNQKLDHLIAELEAANQDMASLVFEVTSGNVRAVPLAVAMGLKHRCERCRCKLPEPGCLCDRCAEELAP